LGFASRRTIDHIDLIEPQPNPFVSLKTLNGRLHGERMQDLPIDPDAVPTDEQMDILIDYCLNSDLPGTENLWNSLAEPIAMRVAIGKEYGTDFRSKSDAQMGEAMIKRRVEQATASASRRSARRRHDVQVPDSVVHQLHASRPGRDAAAPARDELLRRA
jgi:hypothetical protein